MISRQPSLILLALAGALCLAAGPAQADRKKRAGSPIRDAEKLADRQRAAERKLIKEHLALAKRLQKDKAEWEAWLELRYLQRLDPDHPKLKLLLPEVQPALPEKLAPEFEPGHGELVKLAGEELGEVLDRGQRGQMKPEELAPVARRMLCYDGDDEDARKVLGFLGSKGRWVQRREAEVMGRYAEALAKVPAPEPLKASPFPKLEQALGLELEFVKGRHCWAAGVKGKVQLAQLETIAKSAEVAYAAMHADLLGVPNSVFGGERVATGGAQGPFTPMLFLMLDGAAQHDRFLQRVVTDKDLRIAGRGLTFVSAWWREEKLLVCDNRAAGKFLLEWPAQRIAFQVINQRFGDRRPTYLVQGLARYYSAHVSGQAMIRTVPIGSKSRDEQRLQAGDYAQLRSLARWGVDNFRVDPPATLGLYKDLNSMNRIDNALATAFIDFLLATRKGALIKLLQVSDAKKQGIEASFAEAFGQETPAALDQAFAEWFQANY
ncbi:MAG: hypothetical protein AB7N76_03645 [Planctomycetota bacterium]